MSTWRIKLVRWLLKGHTVDLRPGTHTLLFYDCQRIHPQEFQNIELETQTIHFIACKPQHKSGDYQDVLKNRTLADCIFALTPITKP